MRKVQEFWSQALALAIFAALCWLFYLTLHHAWLALVGVSPQLAVALIAGTSTILVGTLTVTLGRYYERKRDIESHFRTEKIKIYDEFLQELFKVFHSETQLVAGPGDDCANGNVSSSCGEGLMCFAVISVGSAT
jgi:hypothetical protein